MWYWEWERERERERPEEKGFGRRYREWAMAEERYKFAHLDLINQNPSHVPRVQEYYIVNLTLYIFYYFDLAPLYLKFRFSSTIDSIVYTGWKSYKYAFKYHLFCWKLKTIKKIFSTYCSLLFSTIHLPICTIHGHEQCKRRWTGEKKKKKVKTQTQQTQTPIQTNTKHVWCQITRTKSHFSSEFQLVQLVKKSLIVV